MGLKSVAVALCGAAALSACSGLQFEQDDRLSFTSPAADKVTKVPVTLSWTMKDAPGDTYAVFIDQSPVKVGQTLQAKLADKVQLTTANLAQQQIYTTSTTSLTIPRVTPLDHDDTKRQRHTAIVILLDSHGKRPSEAAWTRSFDLNKDGT